MQTNKLKLSPKSTRKRALLIFIILVIALTNFILLQNVAAQSTESMRSINHKTVLLAASDVPVIDLNGPEPNHSYTTTFTENEGPQLIVASSMTISDSDSTMLKSAMVKLTNRIDGTMEYLEINTAGTNISADYDPQSGLLQLNRTDTISNYQKALSTITYDNLSESPATIDRTITFQVYDGDNYSVEVVSKVLVEAVNDAPILVTDNDFSLSDILEDDANQFGNRVASFIDPAETGGQNPISDPDANSLEGIAVIGVDAGNGSWQFSIDAGTTWLEFGPVSNNAATLLDPASRIRFVPNLNYHGSTNLTIRAWDQTTGNNGDINVDVSENGGNSAFSTATAMVSLKVIAVNDPPIPDLNGVNPGMDLALYYVLGSDLPAIAAPQGAIRDVDNRSLVSATVILKNRPDGSSEILKSGLLSSTITIGPYDPSTGKLTLVGSATLSEYNEALRSIVYDNQAENPSLDDRAIEVTAHDGVENGPTSFTTIHILSTNNAPQLAHDLPLNLDPIDEDDEDPDGNTISEIINSTETDLIVDDEGALRGLAIVGANNDAGQWQFSVDAGNTWWPLGNVTDGSAVLLNTEAKLRFLADPDLGGVTRSLKVRAWDQTSGVNGSKGVGVTQTGSTSAFSAAFTEVFVDVLAINDPPALELFKGITALFTEDNGPVTVTGPSLILSDVDNESLKSATVAITNHDRSQADFLVASPNGTGIVTNYDPEKGVLSLTGNATVADYQAVLRTVAFENRSHDPATQDRIVTFMVRDPLTSSLPVSGTVKVQSVNDLPLIDLNGGDTSGYNAAVQFDESYWGGKAILLASNLELQDLDDSTLVSATVALLGRPDSEAEHLAANTEDTNITAVYNSQNGQLELTGIESLANYERVLSTVSYTNFREHPMPVDRKVSFMVSDYEGTSNNVISRIVVVPKIIMMPILSKGSFVAPESEEPNDTCQEAYPLALGVINQFSAEDKDDWYVFSTINLGDIRVTLSEYEPVEGQILVAGGQCDALDLIGHNGDFSTDKIIDLEDLSPGKYYIWLITDNVRSSGEPYKYNLIVDTR